MLFFCTIDLLHLHRSSRQHRQHDLDRGTPVDWALARYEPFGGYHTRPATTANPDIATRGFTGHRGNNTGTQGIQNLNLIYMNARYYMPEIGRFISADTVVPEPKNPQNFNRYAYALNSPVNFTDPSGHCINNYEPGSADMDTCLAGWNAVTNYLAGAAYGPGGSGHFPNELVNDWLLNADIGTLENLMEVMGIDYGYTWTPPQGYAMPSGGMSLRSPEARAGVCNYWQNCYQPPAEYSSVSLSLGAGVRLTWDRWDNVYVYFLMSTYPGGSVTAGNIRIKSEGEWADIEDLAVDEQELATQAFLGGSGHGTCLAAGVAACVAQSTYGDYALEGGFALPPGLSMDETIGGILYDANSEWPWFWQRWYR